MAEDVAAVMEEEAVAADMGVEEEVTAGDMEAGVEDLAVVVEEVVFVCHLSRSYICRFWCTPRWRTRRWSFKHTKLERNALACRS
jgi:hypothetical protein